MTYLVERLAELRRHLDHLAQLRPRITGAEVLRRDLSLDPVETLLDAVRRIEVGDE